MRDTTKTMKVLPAFSTESYTPTMLFGEWIDRAGFESLSFVISTAAIPGKTPTFVVYHSDNPELGLTKAEIDALYAQHGEDFDLDAYLAKFNNGEEPAGVDDSGLIARGAAHKVPISFVGGSGTIVNGRPVFPEDVCKVEITTTDKPLTATIEYIGGRDGMKRFVRLGSIDNIGPNGLMALAILRRPLWQPQAA
jgi:hypothetical protein